MARDLATVSMGARSIADNLARAARDGKIDVRPDGRWTMPARPARPWYLHVRFVLPLQCPVLNDFLFQVAYAGTTVPSGCAACFKVKLVPANLRGLVALRDLLEAAPYHAKCGVDFYNPHSQDAYAGFAYFDGLPAARAAWRDLRARVDADPALGPSTPIMIKRGCTNYEMAVGPSDRWTFDDDLAELEAELRERFIPPPIILPEYRQARAVAMIHWIRFAFALRDETYLDFTGGRPLHPPIVAYDPVAPSTL